MYSYYLPITNPTWLPVDTQLLSFISPERQQKALNYYHSIDRKLSLYSALLVRMAISNLSGIPASELHFQSKLMHKPKLLSAPQYHFNFSHTRNMILCTISTEGPVGADLENIQQDIPLEGMEKLFHPLEWQYIKNSFSSIRSLRFYKLWTQKEAYIKYLGIGFSKDVSTFNLLDPIFTLHLHTWMSDNYMCSIFLPTITNPIIQLITEFDIQDYFLSTCK